MAGRAGRAKLAHSEATQMTRFTNPKVSGLRSQVSGQKGLVTSSRDLRPRQRAKGQAAIVIALSAILLIAILGLALDGGSMYAQRRNAQNSSDAAAMAATREMLGRYDQMILDYQFDVDGTADDDTAINLKLTQYAQQHGITRSDLEAYYVRDDKQIVIHTQVGSLGYVPWTQGAKGIVVENRAETDSFFMKLFGWNSIGANATSAAFMGIVVDSSTGFPVMPVGFFTNTEHLDDLVFGQEYDLINSDITDTLGSGNWGYIDYNENGSASVVQAWLECGFNPEVGEDRWQEWVESQNCDNQGNVPQAAAPVHHFRCVDHPDCLIPEEDPTLVYYLKWGPGDEGWWLAGQTGTRNSNCQDLNALVQDIVGRRFLVPIFDNWIDGSGSNARFHLASIGQFLISDADVDCHPSGGEDPHWYIRGTFEQFYHPGGTGRHGDLRHTSGHTVFLDN